MKDYLETRATPREKKKSSDSAIGDRWERGGGGDDLRRVTGREREIVRGLRLDTSGPRTSAVSRGRDAASIRKRMVAEMSS